MPQETRLERKLRQLGLEQDPHSTPTAAKRLTFRLYFPRPPYGSVQYSAAKQGDGLNFVGQLLGHGGCTLKKIQTDSGARVEVHDGKGNLNGTHPLYTDPSLHAVVFADSKEKLNAAARMIAEVLQPVDAAFEKFEVVPGGWALLKPAVKREVVHKSPRSETSSRNGGVWGGASTPSSENDTSGADLDSAYVQENTPWRNMKSGSYKPPKPCTEGKTLPTSKSGEKENATHGVKVKEWDTWGRNGSDCYQQFTTLTQNLVSQCARSRQLKQNWEQEYYADHRRENRTYFDRSTTWSPVVSKMNGSNMNSSFTQCSLTHVGAEWQRTRIWAPDDRMKAMDAYPLPHVYEDLIGSGDTPRNPVQESRLTSAYQIPVNSELPPSSQKRVHRYVSLPQDL